MKKVKSSRAFTLVELIVVITILAILWTIGFISLQWYSATARDSVRISDIATMSKALEFYKLEQWLYPIPTDSYGISFSWSLAWNQWIFWEDTRAVTRWISESPRDPLTYNFYSYSVTNTGQEYELWAITERSNLSSHFLVNSVHANNAYFSYVRWNYNKQIVTVRQNDRLYILWVPTIITTEINDVTVQDILSRQSFSIKWSQNLPASYFESLPNGQSYSGSTSFTPGLISLTAPLIYEGTSNDLGSDDEKLQLWEDLIAYYSDSNIAWDISYQNISNISSWEELSYVNSLIRSGIWWIPGSEIVINEIPNITWSDTGVTLKNFCNWDYSSALNTKGSFFSSQTHPHNSAFVAKKDNGDITAWGSTWNWGATPATSTWFEYIYSTQRAFAWLQEDGSIISWGNSSYWGTWAPSWTWFVSISSSERAFAALHTDGTVKVWWTNTYGWDQDDVNDSQVYINVYSTQRAFAGLKADGWVDVWGNGWYGWDSLPWSVNNIQKIFSTERAFAGLKTDGSIVAWWNSGYWAIWEPSWWVYSDISSNERVFAALKSDGSIDAWWDSDYGSSEASWTWFIKIHASEQAFAALKNDGSVEVWWEADYWGDQSELDALSASWIEKIYSNQRVFAALNSSGKIYVWGRDSYGWDQDDVPTGGWFTSIASNQRAFAALHSDWSIHTWGNSSYWSTWWPSWNWFTQIFSTEDAFAALKNDGSIIAWWWNGGTWFPVWVWYTSINWGSCE